MNHNIAFFGTGECDPNKSMKQFFIYAGIVAAWIVLIILLKKILHSRMHKRQKAKAERNQREHDYFLYGEKPPRICGLRGR